MNLKASIKFIDRQRDSRLNYVLGVVCMMVLFAGFTTCSKPTVSIKTISIVTTDNPTVKKVALTLSDSAEVYLRLEHLESGEVCYTNTVTRHVKHEILLPALRPGSQYAYSVLAGDKQLSTLDTFYTEAIPVGIVNINLKEDHPDSFEGYLLTQRRLVAGQAYMINNRGEVVWYQPVPGQLKLAHYTNDGNILTLYGAPHHNNSAGDKITTYSISGEIVYHIDLSQIETELIAHHEVFELENDLMLLVYDTKMIPSPENGALVEVRSDAIIRLDKQGTVLWKWSTFDLKDPGNDPNIMDHLEDWGHANAVAVDNDGHLLISYRDWNQIWKIHSNTGERIWVLGDDGDFEMEPPGYFSGQHAIQVNPNDNYMIFDNGREKKLSRVISFGLTEQAAEIKSLVDLPPDLYADRMGNAVLLPSQNLLVCSPRTRSILVLNNQSSILFHATVGIPDPYRVEYIPPFYHDQPIL